MCFCRYISQRVRGIGEQSGKAFKGLKKIHMKRLSFITQFKIEFLLPFIGCRKVLGKITILKITSLIWNFFQMAISLLAYVATYPGQLYLPQSNYFDKKVTFSEQLYLQRCYFFEVLPFSERSPLPRSLFFFFPEKLLFQSKTSTDQLLLENRSFFTAGAFRNTDRF